MKETPEPPRRIARRFIMPDMKPQTLCKLLNIAPTTLRRWSAEEYAEFLSPSGRGINGAHRAYSDLDSRILAWVAAMRAQNIPLADIVATLRSAQADNWRGLPPLPGGMANDEPIAVIPREAAQERLAAIQERYELQVQALARERDELKAQMAELKAENTELRQKYFAITERLLNMVEKQQDRQDQDKK